MLKTIIRSLIIVLNCQTIILIKPTVPDNKGTVQKLITIPYDIYGRVNLEGKKKIAKVYKR